jgi:hypothetical protein
MLVWWGTEIECAAAVARAERQSRLTPRAVVAAFDRLEALKGSWDEIQPGDSLRSAARRLVRTHDLRSADSMQLAAALVASEGHAASLGFVSLDSRLVEAAHREGLAVVDVDTR